MRAALLCLAAALCGSGCRALHEGVVKQRLLQARLYSADVPKPLAEVDELLNDRKGEAFTTQCLLCLASSRKVEAGTVYCLTSHREAGCVLARPGASPGTTRFEPAPGSPPPTHAVARELWRLLDPQAAAAANNDAIADVTALAIDEEERFEGKWSFYGGLRASTIVTTREPIFSLGAQTGVRRWFGYFLLGGLGLDYDNVLFSTSTQLSTLGPQVRAEVSIWQDEHAAVFNLPGLTFAMSATPFLAFGSKPVVGVRGAVGFYLRKVGEVWAPIFFEVGYQSLAVDDLFATGFRASLGFGL